MEYEPASLIKLLRTLIDNLERPGVVGVGAISMTQRDVSYEHETGCSRPVGRGVVGVRLHYKHKP